MSKFHWLLLLLMAQCFYLIATAPGVWSSLFPLAILLYLTWQYAKEHGDKTYISEAFDLGFKLAEKHNDIQKDLDFLYDKLEPGVKEQKVRPFIAKGEVKKGHGIYIKGKLSKKKMKELKSEWEWKRCGKHGLALVSSTSKPSKKTKKSTKKRK